MRAIVHIGYHKTGSSWLQCEFFPKVRNARLVPRSRVARDLLLPSPFAFDPLAARQSLLEGDPRTLIVSDEELSGNLLAGGLHGAMSKEIATRLSLALPNARIVIFIRNQIDMLAAAYRQYVKSGGSRSIRSFLEPSPAPHKRPHFSLDHLVYDGLVGYYESLFGRDRVSVYPMEELRDDGPGFAARFAAEHDLDVDVAGLDFRPVNAGYRRGTRRLVRLLNHLNDREVPNNGAVVRIPGAFKLTKALAARLDRWAVLGSSETARDLLDPERIARLERRYRDGNGRLDERYKLGLGALGYPMPRESRRCATHSGSSR